MVLTWNLPERTACRHRKVSQDGSVPAEIQMGFKLKSVVKSE